MIFPVLILRNLSEAFPRFFRVFHQLSLGEDLRQKPSTRNLLPLTSDSFLDGPAQMVHDVSWKVDPVEGGQKVENQFVICTGLVRPSSFLKKTLSQEFQKHPVTGVYFHQFG